MPSKKRFTPEEKKVFMKLNITDEDHGLKNLIRGQREINGKLYQAISATLTALEHHVEGTDLFKKGRSIKESIKLARNLIERVPGPPPGCA